MLQTIRWFRQLFQDPLPDCHEAQPKLNELAAELDDMAERINRYQTNAIDEITGYHRMINEMMHSGLVYRAGDELAYSDYDRHEAIIKGLRELQLLLEDDGRRNFRMDRLGPGRPITDANVYLINVVIAGINGRQTMSVQEIKARRHETILYNGMNEAATRVMGEHIGRILTIIHEFDRAMTS